MTARAAVWVQPGASRARIVGRLGNALKVAVTAPPEKGKANQAVVKLLAGELGVPASSVRVVAGAAARRKTIAVDGMTQSALDRWLAERYEFM